MFNKLLFTLYAPDSSQDGEEDDEEKDLVE